MSEDCSVLTNSIAHAQGTPGAGREPPAATGKLRPEETVAGMQKVTLTHQAALHKKSQATRDEEQAATGNHLLWTREAGDTGSLSGTAEVSTPPRTSSLPRDPSFVIDLGMSLCGKAMPRWLVQKATAREFIRSKEQNQRFFFFSDFKRGL